VLGDLENEAATLGLLLAFGKLDLESVQDGGKVLALKVDVDDGTNDGLNGTGLEVGGGRVGADLGCGSQYFCGDTRIVFQMLACMQYK
jgi:hypothetical protein